MIRIEIDRDDLLDKIEEAKPGWIEASKKLTKEVENDPSLELKSNWSAIKKVYMKIQHSKCMFCEKELEEQPVEQDVEHFRPKKKVYHWSVPKEMSKEGVSVVQPAKAAEEGYRLLTYNPLNYGASCKTCNTSKKKNFFPP